MSAKTIVIPDDIEDKVFIEQTFHLMLALVQAQLMVLDGDEAGRKQATSHLLAAYFRALGGIIGVDKVIDEFSPDLDVQDRQVLELIKSGLTADQAKAVIKGENN